MLFYIAAKYLLFSIFLLAFFMTEINSSIKPLAERLRPQKFDEVFGQNKIWKKGALLRTLVEKDNFHSLIFWGPPGTGKTTVASLIGRHSGRNLNYLSAVHAGVKDIRLVLKDSETEISYGRASSILFLDEIHRLSKNQQDVLLPALEGGTIKFIGATTENPSFEVNNAINSRSMVFRFESITSDEMQLLLARALQLIKGDSFKADEDVLQLLASNSNGDARRALNLLDAILNVAEKNDSLCFKDFEKLQSSLPLIYDKKGDNHYDTISAMIKSIRASKADAAVYYLARMLQAGEDPMFIARRLIISASEDIGNANPHALNFAVSGANAVHQIGMPEARIILSQICTFLASSPKSNRSYVAINKALDVVSQKGNLEIPYFLRNAPTKMMKDFGYSKGYIYAHDDPKGAKDMNYLPEEIKDLRFYKPSENGYESNFH